MDHGVTVGPIYGLVDLKGSVNSVAEGGANAVLMHKGLPRATHRGYGKDIGLIIHLSASTALSPTPNAKCLVGTIEDGLRLGADAVSVQVNLGDETEAAMLADLGRVTSRAADWGMPVLAMMYARGPKVADSYAPDIVCHCARVGAELGADMVKVNYTGDMESFARVVEAACVPVVIAGGPKLDDDAALVQMVHDALPGRRLGPVHRPQRLPAQEPGAPGQDPGQGRARGLGRGPGPRSPESLMAAKKMPTGLKICRPPADKTDKALFLSSGRGPCQWMH